jgi:hypothetical protein
VKTKRWLIESLHSLTAVSNAFKFVVARAKSLDLQSGWLSIHFETEAHRHKPGKSASTALQVGQSDLKPKMWGKCGIFNNTETRPENL